MDDEELMRLESGILNTPLPTKMICATFDCITDIWNAALVAGQEEALTVE